MTNVPQLNLWTESRNPVYGLTKNPYNNTRCAGGSSGGEGSIVGACGSPLGIGTDIGGSLRIPAFMCGIFGHKPSPNLISTNGLTFRTGKETETMVAAGPMVKYAEDLIPALKVLVGKNVTKLKLDDYVNIRDVKIFYIEDPKDPFISPFRKETNQKFFKCVEHFKEISNEQPKSVHYEEIQYTTKLWKYWMGQEPEANFKRDLANREGVVNTWSEIFKFILGQSEYNVAAMFSLVNEMLPTADADWAKEKTKLLRYKLTVIIEFNFNLLVNDGILGTIGNYWSFVVSFGTLASKLPSQHAFKALEF